MLNLKQIYIFLKQFPAFRCNLSLKNLFSAPAKELPLVAPFCQEKIDFFEERIFTSIGAIDAVWSLLKPIIFGSFGFRL